MSAKASYRKVRLPGRGAVRYAAVIIYPSSRLSLPRKRFYSPEEARSAAQEYIDRREQERRDEVG